MKKKIFIGCSGLFLLFAVWLGYEIYSIRTTPPSYKAYMETFKAASQILNPVVAAIEKYHAQNGRYPDKLKELVPEYIPQLPPAPEGFFTYYGKDNNWIDYDQLHDKASQPYELSAFYMLGALSGDLHLYYRKSPDLLPTIPAMWKAGKYRNVVDEHWIYWYE